MTKSEDETYHIGRGSERRKLDANKFYRSGESGVDVSRKVLVASDSLI